jgi:hypothetical protein
VQKSLVGLIAICALAAMLAASCAPAHGAAGDSVRVKTGVPPAAAPQLRPVAYGAGSSDQTGRLPRSDSDALFQTAESPIGIDYAPETRCSDNNPNWLPGLRPLACKPPLGEPCGDSLSTCPSRCQKCYADDLSFIKRELKVNTITIYQTNYYILKAADQLGIKVVVGLLNDAVLGLATPASQTNCSYGGTPLYLCGSEYASAVIDGVCTGTVGGDPFAKCVRHCSLRSNPARDCAKGDCSCDTDADCKGPANQCLKRSYFAPLNNSATGEFLRDGTVIGIQLGNEFFGQCQIPGVPGQNQPCCAHNHQTGQCRAWIVNQQVYSAAAQTLRRALDSRGLKSIKISVGLVGEQGPRFCRDGAPPPGIDYIAAHPYCDFVADVPPYWATLGGAECWDQARDAKFAVDQKACGAARTYMGETGYNSGCPAMAHEDTKLKAESDFVQAMLAAEPACNGKPNPAAPFPNFLFEFGDTGPPGGCMAGCGDPVQCNPRCCCKHQCSDQAICKPGCPACFGNGYFGLYRTPGYGTAGFPPDSKFDPPPTLLCPAAQK